MLYFYPAKNFTMIRITPKVCLTCCFFPFFAVHAQEPAGLSAMPSAVAAAYAADRQQAFAFTVNPAALSGIRSFSGGFYAEQRFLLREVQLFRFALARPTRAGNFGLSLTHDRIAAFQGSGLSIAYARPVGSVMDLGILFRYNTQKIREYDNAQAFTAVMGMRWKLGQRVYGGIVLDNPLRSGWSDRGEKLPATYTSGWGFSFSPQCRMVTELVKTEGQPLLALVGISYDPADRLVLEAGVRSGVSGWYVGAGVRWRQWEAHSLLNWHPQLGFSPALTLLFRSPEKQSFPSADLAIQY
jgi:hypothetical protein